MVPHPEIIIHINNDMNINIHIDINISIDIHIIIHMNIEYYIDYYTVLTPDFKKKSTSQTIDEFCNSQMGLECHDRSESNPIYQI